MSEHSDTHDSSPGSSEGGHQHGSMSERGVTRHGMGSHGDSHQEHGHGHEMSADERRNMMIMHHRKTLWIWWLMVLLGFWMMAAPVTFEYGRVTVPFPEGRDVWLSLEDRVRFMRWSDFWSGVLLVFLGWRCLTPGRPVSQWLACFVGIWLQIAPILFWCPSPVAYLNDTLIGALVIALTVLIPGMPSMIMYMKMGPEVPPGWTYNPSSWPQRWIMIAFGFAGWLVSRYLAAFQLGYTGTAWDPFFGEGSRRVLTSNMSHAWPISDAALGAFSYTFEFLMGWMGSVARWRTMPWMVLFFGILIVPLGLTHIILVISQPVFVNQWCTLCLLAAVIMLPMIPLTLDEVVAMCQFMYKKVKLEGEPFWKTFWKGGTIEGGEKDSRSPQLGDLPQFPMRTVRSSLWGMSFPWNLNLLVFAGLWLVFSPAAFGIPITEQAANSDHLVGALVVTVTVIAMSELFRAFRWLNIPLGLWLLIAPWVLSGFVTAARVNDMILGVIVIALSIPRGKILERYGTWQKFIR